MIQCAQGATKKKNSFYQAKCNKLTLKTGSRNKAKVAIANRMARAIYKILSNPEERFKDRGYQEVFSEARRIKTHIQQLKKLGVEVEYLVLEKIIKAKKEIEVEAA